MNDYEIYSHLEKDFKAKILTSSFIVQVRRRNSLALTNFSPNYKEGYSIIELCIIRDDSTETRQENYLYKIPWDGKKHIVTIVILNAPGGDVINKSTDIVDSDDKD